MLIWQAALQKTSINICARLLRRDADKILGCEYQHLQIDTTYLPKPPFLCLAAAALALAPAPSRVEALRVSLPPFANGVGKPSLSPEDDTVDVGLYFAPRFVMVSCGESFDAIKSAIYQAGQLVATLCVCMSVVRRRDISNP